MRIVIASPLSPPDIGGPSYYSEGLAAALRKLGHSVTVVAYGKTERSLPAGIRHLWYFLRLLPRLLRARLVIGLDAWSVGLPAILAARLTRVPIMVRVGGDYLWERYIERTGIPVLHSQFYDEEREYSRGERMVFVVTRAILRHANLVVFSTKWQGDFWQEPYRLDPKQIRHVDNVRKASGAFRPVPQRKHFIWAGRRIPFKNVDIAKLAFRDAELERPERDITFELLPSMHRDELLQHMRAAYAVVLPSISEVSPNFLLEAVSEGIPFITTADMGLLDVLRGCGLFVDTRSREALKDAFLQMTDTEVNGRFRKYIAESITARNYDDVAQDFLTLYADLT